MPNSRQVLIEHVSKIQTDEYIVCTYNQQFRDDSIILICFVQRDQNKRDSPNKTNMNKTTVAKPTVGNHFDIHNLMLDYLY